MRTQTFLILSLLILPAEGAFAQNDVSLYNTWKSYDGDMSWDFYDRNGDDVDMGTITMKQTYQNGDFCKCNITMSIPFDWITKDGIVSMYFNLYGSTLSIDHVCSGGNEEYNQIYKDGCNETANTVFNNWKAGFNPSVEKPYSIYGNVLKFDGMNLNAVYPVVQPVQPEENQSDERYELVEIVEDDDEEIQELLIQPEKKNGIQTYTWEDGTTYDGNWKDDKRNGFGTVTWTDGSSYAGEWFDDYMHGKGTYTWPDGNKYTGDFNYNRMEGTGTLTTSAGDIYTGEWLNNKKNGKGTFKWADGSSYSGQWKENYFHGRGIYISPSGIKQEGEFVEGVFVE